MSKLRFKISMALDEYMYETSIDHIRQTCPVTEAPCQI